MATTWKWLKLKRERPTERRFLAGVGAALWPSVDAACAAVIRVAQRVAANPNVVSKMTESYAAFQRVYPATRSVFKS